MNRTPSPRVAEWDEVKIRAREYDRIMDRRNKAGGDGPTKIVKNCFYFKKFFKRRRVSPVWASLEIISEEKCNFNLKNNERLSWPFFLLYTGIKSK